MNNYLSANKILKVDNYFKAKVVNNLDKEVFFFLFFQETVCCIDDCCLCLVRP